MKHPRLIGLGIVLWIIYTGLVWQAFTARSPGGNDFMTHYAAWNAYMKYGLNPYSDEAALYAQQQIYGRPAKPTEDQNRLAYPFYSIALHGPFILIGDYALARAVYMTLLQVALLAGVGLVIRALHWRLSFGWMSLVCVWALFDYPQARGILLGQFAIFGFFSVAAVLYGLQHERDGLAGAVLVISTIKPTLVFLVVPYLLIWAAVRRRWRFVIGFGVTLGAAMAMSWLVLPTWLTDWLYRMENYAGYTVGQSPIWLLTHQVWPALGETGEWILAALLMGAVLAAWWRAFRAIEMDWFYWALGVTLVISNLIVPRSATTNYALLLAPTLWLFARLDQASRKYRAVIIGYMVLSVCGLWSLHLATIVGNQEQPIMFVPAPVVLGLALVVAGVLLSRKPPIDL